MVRFCSLGDRNPGNCFETSSQQIFPSHFILFVNSGYYSTSRIRCLQTDEFQLAFNYLRHLWRRPDNALTSHASRVHKTSELAAAVRLWNMAFGSRFGKQLLPFKQCCFRNIFRIYLDDFSVTQRLAVRNSPPRFSLQNKWWIRMDKIVWNTICQSPPNECCLVCRYPTRVPLGC